MEPMPADVLGILRAASPAVIATVDQENRPVSVTTWYTLEDEGHVLLSIMTQGARGGRLDHLRANPYISLTVMDTTNWNNAVNVLGRVTELFEDTDLVAIDAMSERHFGRPFADRSPRTCARVEVTGWENPRRRW